MFWKRVLTGCFLILVLVVLESFIFENMIYGEEFMQRRGVEEVTFHPTLFRMGELKFFPNDVVRYEVRPVFYFCGEFCPVKIVSPSLQIEKKSFIKIKTN